MDKMIVLPCGRKASKLTLEHGIMLFEPRERGKLVDAAFNTIPGNEKEKLVSWMRMNGNGMAEKYYLFLLAVAGAASQRGEVSRERMLEVFQDIERGKTILGVLF